MQLLHDRQPVYFARDPTSQNTDREALPRKAIPPGSSRITYLKTLSIIKRGVEKCPSTSGRQFKESNSQLLGENSAEAQAL